MYGGQLTPNALIRNRSLVAFLLFLAPAAAAIGGVPGPTFTKVFAPDTMGPGSVSTLTFTITNNDAGAPIMDMAFTDTLPAGVTIADPAIAFTDCDIAIGGAGVDAPDGGGTIVFADGELDAGGTCTVTVDVTATAAVDTTFSNTSSVMTSDHPDSGTATDDLMIDVDRPGFSKSFAPSSVPLGDRSTLTFTIDNSANDAGAANLIFTDNLPSGIVVADPAGASTTCAGVITATPGMSVISFTGGSVSAPPATSTCTLSVDVVATGVGELDNTTGELTSLRLAPPFSTLSSGKASDTLDVTVTPIALQKEFTDDEVPPGGFATLELTITNFDRLDSATGIFFTDDLTQMGLVGLTANGLPLTDLCGAGNGTLSGSAGDSFLTFSGATLGPEGSCTFSVSLMVPLATTPGIYNNTTTAVEGTVGGSPVVGNVASDKLFVEPVPTLTKEFVGDPVVAGDSVTLRFTITNTSTTSAATAIAFTDELTAFLSGVGVTLPGAGFCNGSGSIFNVAPPPGVELSMTGGVLAAAGSPDDSCTFDVDVQLPATFPAGTFPNTTSAITATVDGATRTGLPASDSLEVVAAPSLSKAFTDDPVQPGDTVTLEFTLSHSLNSPADATAITFTDNLDAALSGLVAITLPPAGSICNGGTISGTSSLTFSGGSLMPGEACTFQATLQVPVAAPVGAHLNTTSNVSATVSGVPVTSVPGSDSLQVALLTITKSFTDDPVIAGGTVTLEFTITNLSPTLDATVTLFRDDLDATLSGLVSTSGTLMDICGLGSQMTGTSLLEFTGGTLLAGAPPCSWSVTLDVPAGTPDGDYNNTTILNLATLDGSPIIVDPATDSLVVSSTLLSLAKEFTDDPAAPGDPVTLEFILTNLDAGNAASAIDFTDDLAAALAGLTFDSVLFEDCGATVSGQTTTTITVTGASLSAGGSCSIRTSLTVPGGAAGSLYDNTTSALTGTINGLAISGDAASDVLEVVELLSFSKSFDGPTTATGTPVLTFTITNPRPSSVIDLFFADDLDAVLTGLAATNLPLADVCGSGSLLSGTTTIVLTGGTLAPTGGTCSFDVDLLVPGTATAGTFPNTTSNLFLAGLPVADPATALLTIEAPPLFSKVFTPGTVAVGAASALRFDIDNSASALAAGALTFTDNLPAGLSVRSPAVTSNTCGGALTAVAGSGVISHNGGTVAAGSACFVQVDVVASALGTYPNTTGDLGSSSGNSGPASDSLIVSDTIGPLVTALSTVAGGLQECSNVRDRIGVIHVQITDDFSAILNADDPASYLLVEAGPDRDFSTSSCAGGVAFDDVGSPILGATPSNTGPTDIDVDLQLSGSDGLAAGMYRLFVCDTITDSDGNALDGGDFVLSFFRADPDNLFENAHFDDCPVSLDPWVLVSTPPNAVLPGIPGFDDFEASPLSASARVLSAAPDASSIAQCLGVTGGTSYGLEARVFFQPMVGAFALLSETCEFFDGAACSGLSVGTSSVLSLLEPPGGIWKPIQGQAPAPLGALSAVCYITVETLGGDPDFDVLLDGLFFGTGGRIFADGFESGDISAWSSSTP